MRSRGKRPAARAARGPLAPEQLRFVCAPELCAPVPGEAGRDVRGIFAQARALSALRLGLEISSPGYNIFVTGVSGSGRMSAVEEVLAELRTRAPVQLEDRAYVHNFADPSRPRLITLPSGHGRALQKAAAELIELAQTQLSQLFDNEALRAERARIERRYREQDAKVFADYQAELVADGLGLGQVGEGPEAATDVFVIVGEKPVPIEVLRADAEVRAAFASERGLDPGASASPSEGRATEPGSGEGDRLPGAVEEALREIEKRHEHQRDRLAELLRASRRLERELERELHELEVSRARIVLRELIADLEASFPYEAVRVWLAEVEADLLENLGLFVEDEGDEDGGEPAPAGVAPRRVSEHRRLYSVNVVLDTSAERLPPIIVEPNPTFVNLFGAIERDGELDGASRAPDFTAIRAGALLRADGGYLVMYARDVLLEPGVWRTLVRALRSERLEIQPAEEASHLLPSALKPEPIPLTLKVVLIGDDELYELLTSFEEDFRKIFKVKAELDTHTELTPETIARFTAIARRVQEREALLPFEPGGYAALVELAVRWAGSQRELSTRFGDVADLMRESSYLAKRAGARVVDAAAVEAGRRARIERHALVDHQLSELLRREILLVDTRGERVGQVNGLAVYGPEPDGFGKPSRITATAGAGRGGLVNIEREVHLSGPTHDKGILILAGWLRGRYGRERPLALTASIAFEQSYGEVDGDSASLAELCCLLSAISGLPARQSVAITGSVNQLGDVQAVGGVNEKIEGFFRLVRERGLDGTHAVVIPEANVQTLMLDPEVIAACRAGRFAVYAVREVDEVVPIVFGEAAKRLHARVASRLRELAATDEAVVEVTRRTDEGRRSKKLPRPPADPRPRTPGS